MNMKCCTCGKEFEGYGHNPYPIGYDVYSVEDRCCDECNYGIVLPARMLRLDAKHANRLEIASFEDRDALKVGEVVYVLVNHKVRKAEITDVGTASDGNKYYFGGYHSLEAYVSGVGEMCIDEYVIYK
jgi:hypothetical protein